MRILHAGAGGLTAATAPRAPGSWDSVREVGICGVVAGIAAGVAVFVLPRGGDLAAHLYRTDLVRHGVLVWDNLWFAGQYPLTSYSLLYYFFAAAIGNGALGIAGVVVAAAIFASIAQREWHAVARWPARAFALLIPGQTFTAAYPYDMGVATLLATLWALQRRRTWLAVGCTILTLGFSPLAFLFLALALTAVALRRRRITRQSLAVGTAVAVAGGLQLAALVILPTHGLVYPYGTWRLLVGLGIAACGIVLSLRGRAGWTLARVFVVWAVASVAADVFPTPVGHNLVRASIFVFPLMLVAAALADFRPRWFALVATIAALTATVAPYAAMIPDRSSTAGAHAAFWRPLVRFLRSHAGHDFRVEVVPTANHWESYYLPAAGIALARGWYRQLDVADNPVLYAKLLPASAYRAWLRRSAVRFVVVPNLPLEAIDAERESSLIRSGRAGLRKVWSSRTGRVYELADAAPLLTGPGRARITVFSSSEVAGWVPRAGTYLLRVRYTPYWSIGPGSICLTPAQDGMTRFRALSAGRFALKAVEAPLGVVDVVTDARRQAGGCR